MAYPNLTKYVDQINDWARIFSKQPKRLTINSPKDRNEIRNQLECDLSPENLCCDGELDGQALIRKSRFLNAALDELNQRERV